MSFILIPEGGEAAVELLPGDFEPSRRANHPHSAPAQATCPSWVIFRGDDGKVENRYSIQACLYSSQRPPAQAHPFAVTCKINLQSIEDTQVGYTSHQTASFSFSYIHQLRLRAYINICRPQCRSPCPPSCRPPCAPPCQPCRPSQCCLDALRGLRGESVTNGRRTDGRTEIGARDTCVTKNIFYGRYGFLYCLSLCKGLTVLSIISRRTWEITVWLEKQHVWLATDLTFLFSQKWKTELFRFWRIWSTVPDLQQQYWI